MVNAVGLSGLVLLAFLAAATAFLLLAKVFAAIPAIEIWLAAIALVVVSSALLWVLSDLGVLLVRTTALIHAGFAGLILLWANLRRDTSLLGPPAGATIRSGVVFWLVAIPGAGLLLWLPSLWDLALAPELVGVLQATAVGAAWLVTMKRMDRGSGGADFEVPSIGRPARGLPSARGVEPPQRNVRIFVSYRREDSADVTGRLYDRLVARFGRERVFKDVDSIPLGVDFRTHLREVVGASDVVVAVIGERWLSAGGEHARRLDDEQDFVRIELEVALQRQIPVVPVLVGGARMPSAGDLPPTLAALVYRHGQTVRRDPDFHHDMDRLIRGLENDAFSFSQKPERTRSHPSMSS